MELGFETKTQKNRNNVHNLNLPPLACKTGIMPTAAARYLTILSDGFNSKRQLWYERTVKLPQVQVKSIQSALANLQRLSNIFLSLLNYESSFFNCILMAHFLKQSLV